MLVGVAARSPVALRIASRRLSRLAAVNPRDDHTAASIDAVAGAVAAPAVQPNRAEEATGSTRRHGTRCGVQSAGVAGMRDGDRRFPKRAGNRQSAGTRAHRHRTRCSVQARMPTPGPAGSGVPFPPLQHPVNKRQAVERHRRLFEVDVTEARRAIRAYRARTGASPAPTASHTARRARRRREQGDASLSPGTEPTGPLRVAPVADPAGLGVANQVRDGVRGGGQGARSCRPCRRRCCWISPKSARAGNAYHRSRRPTGHQARMLMPRSRATISGVTSLAQDRGAAGGARCAGADRVARGRERAR